MWSGFVPILRSIHGELPQITHGNWRAGDQRYYVSDIRKFSETAGWTPCYSVGEGVRKLYEWLSESLNVPTKADAGLYRHQEVYPSSVAEASQ